MGKKEATPAAATPAAAAGAKAAAVPVAAVVEEEAVPVVDAAAALRSKNAGNAAMAPKVGPLKAPLLPESQTDATLKPALPFL